MISATVKFRGGPVVRYVNCQGLLSSAADIRQAEVKRLQPVLGAGANRVRRLPTPCSLAVAPPVTPLIARRTGCNGHTTAS